MNEYVITDQTGEVIAHVYAASYPEMWKKLEQTMDKLRDVQPLPQQLLRYDSSTEQHAEILN